MRNGRLEQHSARAPRPPGRRTPDTGFPVGGRSFLESLVEQVAGPSDGHRPWPPRGAPQLFDELARAAHREVIGMFPDDGRGAAAMQRSRSQHLELLRRSVTTHVLCEPGWAADPEVAAEVRLRLDAGARVGVITRVPHWLAVIDRRVALLRSDPRLEASEVVVVRECRVIAELCALFTGLWHRSRSFGDVRADESSPCPRRHRQVLELMNQGVTDETAAKEMAVSVRTYRRYVAEVMNSLGIQSRFQAGVRAVERGWL